jgi:hypothetical protein
VPLLLVLVLDSSRSRRRSRMRHDRNREGENEPPPIESAGQLERVPRTSGAATASQQLHLRVTLASRAAQNMRGVLERDGKRVGGCMDLGGLLTSFCVDIAEIDLQKYTGTVRVCSCDAFDRWV